jgi:glycosyltransferase involved in cell wall biosynthesis
VRVGILSREFFESSLGRMGGFGYAARVTSEVLAAEGLDPVLLSGAAPGPEGITEARVGDVPVVFARGSRWRDARVWRGLRPGVLVTIDWHWSFAPVLRALPRTPVIVWSRDPRSAPEWDRIAGLALPGGVAEPGLEPRGSPTDASLARVARWARRWRRPVEYRFTDEFLVERFTRRFGFDPPGWEVLGTPVERARDAADLDGALDALPVGGRPWVVFLGRLDPIKRPWVFEALAAAMPEIDLVVAGRLHIDVGWAPSTAPNLHHLGHVDGVSKDALLAGAAATVNTSIHEAIPLSLLESLHHGTPLVACLDPGGIVSRFGVAVADAPGDGLGAVAGLATAIRSLVADPARAQALGSAGRTWVRGRHSQPAFRAAFARALEACGS